jgi:hypothetical protein
MKGWLSRRCDEIADYLEKDGKTFACHKTTHLGLLKESHCAGALHMVHKHKIKHKSLELAKLLELYPGEEYLRNMHLTFDTLADFRKHHKREAE